MKSLRTFLLKYFWAFYKKVHWIGNQLDENFVRNIERECKNIATQQTKKFYLE
jgi:hypothetical protein